MYRHVRILVAEDNEADAFLLKRAFLRAGINARMEVVPDGVTAVGYLLGEGPFRDRAVFPMPHLMILDVKMPGLDGLQVLKWLREQPGLRRLPVVVFSSSDEERDVNRAHDLGANGYTRKPSSLEGLGEFVSGIEAYWLRQHRYPTLQS
jgi:CheY-like chemotaxis protein